MAAGIHFWPHLLEMTEEQCKAKLRCMELEAYSCIVAVLRARGPLTDEKLNFMKQCAKEFHISQERHKVEIRKASNSELLSTIAEMLYGPNTETKWFTEGRRLAPILNTEPRQSVYIELANRMAELAKLHNASLPTYSEYKDESIQVENIYLKEEEEALIKELEAQVKAQEEELKKIQAPPPPVPSVEISEETSMECHETMPVEPQPTETVEVMEQDQVVEIKEHDNSYVVVEEVEQIEQSGVEIKKSPSPRKQEVAAKAKLPKAPLGVGESKLSLVLGPGRDKTPPARKKKRSLSIEMYDGSSTPPKRFSNVPPPRIPATPVSQRPPRFQSSQPSPRIMVVPGSMQQPHSSMTHINTGSTVRKPTMKTLGPPAPPIISKIQRPRMYSTPIKNMYTSGSESSGGNKPLPSPSFTSSLAPVTSSSNLSPSGKNNMILVQKTTSAVGPSRITLATPNKKDPSKFMVNKPQNSSTSVPSGTKSVLLKSSGSSSQNNVILVDITQDQLSGNLSVEELLKASGLSNQPTTVTNTTGAKSTTTALPNIIKLQNPKSIGSLPANIQQIKIIKSSGSKFVLTTSAGCSMETVLSLAQSSSSSSSPIFTPSSSTVSRSIMQNTGRLVSTTPLKTTVTTMTGSKISIPSPITTPKVMPSSLAPSSTPLTSSKMTPFGSLTPRSTPLFTSVRTSHTPRVGSSTHRPPITRASTPRLIGSRAPNTSQPPSSISSSSTSGGNISTGSHLADWLSNYVVSDKDIGEESDSSPLFEDVSYKI